MSDSRVPVFVLTGFLGSGKTTLLNGLLVDYPETAVVINELGEVGIDNQLVEDQSVPVTLLAGGCICCTVRGNLGSTLRNLWMARRGGSIAPFSRIVIETTGVADPSGLLEVLNQDAFLSRSYRLAAVLTTVDSTHGLEGLQRFPEVLEQVLVADTLLMTRADQSSAEALVRLREGLARLNAEARIEAVQPGLIPPALLDDRLERRCRFTGIVFSSGAVLPGIKMGPLLASGIAHRNSDIWSASLRFDSPVERWKLMPALEQVLGENARHLLRFKGIFNIVGSPLPLLVQAVSQGMDEPREMRQWPDSDRDSRMVIIVSHSDAGLSARILNSLTVLLGVTVAS